MCDATNEESIKRVYQVKNRPLSKPLILLMDSYEMIKKYTQNITSEEEMLIKGFMPGLVTIILEKNNQVSNLITSNTNYVGIRIPNNKELLEIIHKLGKPIVSTSANISEEKTITSIQELEENLKKHIDYIYDGGIQNGVSSTIVKFNDHKLTILREGILGDKLRERFK